MTIISQLRTKYSTSNCPNHVRRTKRSVKKRIKVSRTVRSMVGEQTVHPIKNGLYTFSSMVTEPDEDDGTRGLSVTLRYPNTLEKVDIKRIKTHKSVWTKV